MSRHLIGFTVLLQVIFFTSTLHADDPKPATIKVKEGTYWVGQRTPFFVELRAAGTFSGAASFSLPEIPKTAIVKVGNPTVSSEQDSDTTWFVQTHEFALFTQQDGAVTIPSFEIRFEHHDGFVGPVKSEVVKTDPVTVIIQRPDGSSVNQFVVTTTSLEVTETWDPQPGATQVGAVFHRVIKQSADQMTGMALAPPSESIPNGIKIYLDQPEITDNTERGEFTGTRTDRITYVMQASGAITIPAVSYVWWNPETKQFGQTTLPEVTFDVAAPVAPSVASTKPVNRTLIVGIVGLVLAMLSLMSLLRHRILAGFSAIWQRWIPPEKVAIRQLLSACRRNHAADAEAAWIQWQNITAFPSWKESEQLEAAVLDLHRHLYDPTFEGSPWNGQRLAGAFKTQRESQPDALHTRTSPLPALNPSR